MKRSLLLIAIATLFAGGLSAQEMSADGLRWKGYYNNGFWSNMELTVGGGVTYTAWNKWGGKQGKFGDNIGWTAEITATKWFNPIIGMRLQASAGQLNMSNEAHDKADSYWMMPHLDGIVNLSNWIGGYREDRIYYAKIFAGMGTSIVDIGDDGSAGFAMDAGMNHTFRVSPALDINLEMKTVFTPGSDMPRAVKEHTGRMGQIYTATLGLTYRFNKRNWELAYSQTDVDGYLAAIAVLEVGLAEALQNEKQLSEQLAKQQSATNRAVAENKELRTELVREERIITNNSEITSSAIFFTINSAALSDQAKATLQLVSQAIKNTPAETKFTIIGHADAKTGTPKYNQTLSEKRAKCVYDYLVKHGIDKSRLSWKGVGSTDTLFPVNNTNRVVIVE